MVFPVCRNCLSILIMLYLVLICFVLNAQKKIESFHIFDESDGLVKGIISGVQDNEGFLWFGTDGNNGVFRYDGITFKQYSHDPQDENSIVPGSIFSIICDQSGKLWFASDSGGLSCFDPYTTRFSTYNHNSDDVNSIGSNTIYSLMEDQEGNIWIGTMKSLDKFSSIDNRITHYYPDSNTVGKLSSSVIYHLYESEDGLIWIGTYGGGLNVLDPETETFKVYRNNPADPFSLAHNTCGSIIEDKEGYIWIGGKGGLNRFDRTTGQFTRFQHDSNDPDTIADNLIWDIYEDKNGFLWLGGFGGGVGKFDKRTGMVHRFMHDNNIPKSLSSNLVFFILEDSGGVFWIGTAEGGLNKYSPQNEQFEHYRHIPGDSNSFSSLSLFTIYQTKDNLVWLGGQGQRSGLSVWDRKQQLVRSFIPDRNSPGSIPEGEVLSLYEDSAGDLYIGQFGGLTVLDREKEVFSRVFPTEEYKRDFSDKMVRKIIEDTDGNLWLATEGGLVKAGVERGEFEILFDSIAFTTLYLDDFNKLWLGTNSEGIIIMDLATYDYKRYFHDPGDSYSLALGEISLIYKDNKGQMWIGIIGGGLNFWNPADKNFRHYSTKDGLASNTILGLVEDSKNRFWIGTSEGLVTFDYNEGIVRNYSVFDGLQSNEFSIRNDNAMKGSDGLFYFVGKNGLTVFDPLNIRENEKEPEVVLTSVKVFNKEPDLETAPLALNSLEFSWRDSMLSFEFAALDFLAPQNNMYAYKLEGFDQDYIKAGNNSIATYTNLDGGDYILHVKASNNHGVWNQQGISLGIRIIPPWWNTNLFYSFLLLFILAVIILVFYYIRKLLNEILEHEKSDKALQKLQKYTSNIIDSMPSTLIGIDRGGLINQWNTTAEKNTGLLFTDVFQQPVDVKYPLLAGERELIRKSIESGQVEQITKKKYFLHNEAVYLNIVIYPIITDHIEGAVIRIDDLTEQVHLEEVMIQSEKMLSVGGLAAGMAHEINNPLAGLIQTANILKKRLIEDIENPVNRKTAEQSGISIYGLKSYMLQRKIPDLFSAIEESGARITGIVGNMLSFSRMSKGVTIPVNISDLLDKSVELAGTDYDVGTDYDFKRIKITREYGEDVPDFQCESSKLQQVLMNILRNASQAMHMAETVSPRINLRTMRILHEQIIRLEIEDNGPGMPDEVCKRIFEPFFTTKTVGIGTGLGLSVSYFIIHDQMNGDLRVSSFPGKGCKFTIELPI